MRAVARATGLAVLAALALGACASRERIVLLPKGDGSTGAIAATRKGDEVLLDSPYAEARTGLGGLSRGTTDLAAVEKRFGAALGAMPPAPRAFTVYFLSGGDELAPESLPEVEAMLQDMAARPEPEVSVVGHTDGVGDAAANDALSLQRAGRVKELLVARGVPAARIDVAGRGEREPLVPAGDEADEPRNRRVEISVR